MAHIGRGDDKVGNPHRAQISQFELFELVLLLKLDKQFPVEQFEATVSQSTVPSPPSYALLRVRLDQDLNFEGTKSFKTQGTLVGTFRCPLLVGLQDPLLVDFLKAYC